MVAWVVGAGLVAGIFGVGFVAVGVGLMAEMGGAGASAFFLWGFAAVDARGLMLRFDFAFFAVASTAEGAVFWTRGFAAVTAFRRKAGGAARQPPRRPIARALGHRADILRLIRVRSLGKKQVLLVFMLSRNKELVVQSAVRGRLRSWRGGVGIVSSNAT